MLVTFLSAVSSLDKSCGEFFVRRLSKVNWGVEFGDGLLLLGPTWGREVRHHSLEAPVNDLVVADWRWGLWTNCQKSDMGTFFPVKDASDLSASISSPSHRLLN